MPEAPDSLDASGDRIAGVVPSRRPAADVLRLPPPAVPGGATLARLGEHVLGLTACRELYEAAERTGPASPREFADAVLAAHGVDLRVEGLEHLKQAGDSGKPVLVVANHPFGGVEGVAMVSLLRGVRPDARVLANRVLGRLEGLGESFVLVDILGEGKVASHRAANGLAMREAMRLLKGGGMMGMFPAGEVAHLTWRDRRVVEGTWHAHLVGLVRRTNATVVPLFFRGRNPLPFQLAGLVHSKLRTILLARQMRGTRRRPLHARFGRPIPPNALATMDPTEAVDHLRSSTLCLGYADAAAGTRRASGSTGQSRAVASRARATEPVREVGAVEWTKFEAELDGLPGSALLAASGAWQVFVARSGQLPGAMSTLGALREATFREVGEGTGRPIDLDSYDDRYHHILLWHRGRGELAGAYRIGPAADQPRRSLPPNRAPDLYTLREFRLPQSLLRSAPLCDLGRSFIRPDFQREASALLLLWRGIAAFLDRRGLGGSRLIGPVSISGDYSPAARAAIAAYLLDPKRRGRFEAQAKRVRPAIGFGKFDPAEHLDPGTLRLARRLTDVRQLDALVRDMTGDRGVPILLRQYVKLGAVPLQVAVDPQFGDCLDVCCLFDRSDADPRRVARITAQRHRLVAA